MGNLQDCCTTRESDRVAAPDSKQVLQRAPADAQESKPEVQEPKACNTNERDPMDRADALERGSRSMSLTEFRRMVQEQEAPKANPADEATSSSQIAAPAVPEVEGSDDTPQGDPFLLKETVSTT